MCLCVCVHECTFFFYFSLFLHENFILSFCWTHFYRSRCHRCSHFSALLHTAIECTNAHTKKFKIYHHIKWHVYGPFRTNCTENHNKIFSINIQTNFFPHTVNKFHWVISQLRWNLRCHWRLQFNSHIYKQLTESTTHKSYIIPNKIFRHEIGSEHLIKKN